jgi:hypothetical protein
MKPMGNNTERRRSTILAIGVLVAAIALAYGILYLANGLMISNRMPGVISSPTQTAARARTPTLTSTPNPRIEVAPRQLVYVKRERASRGQALPDTYPY